MLALATWRQRSTRPIRVPVVKYVEGKVDRVELHLGAMVRPGFRNVVRLDPDRDERWSAKAHAGHDALSTLTPEALR